MPRPTDTRVGRGSDLAVPQREPERLRVVARPVDTVIAPENQANDPLAQLAAGLAQFNPALGQYLQRSNTIDAMDAIDGGTAAAQKDVLAGMNPKEAIKSPISMPEEVNPAFSKHFERGYREVLGQRIAEGLQGDLLKEYSKVRLENPEGVEQFITAWTQKHTAGIDDPLVLEAVTKRHTEAVRAIRSDAVGLLQQRAIASAKESVAASFGALTGDMDTATMADVFHNQIAPAALRTNLFTRTELSGMLLEKINSLSTAMGGRPELYEQVFKEAIDPSTGKTMVQMNPKFAESVEQLQAQASAQAYQKLEKANQPAIFERKLKWEERAAKGDIPSAEEVKAEIGPLGMFKSDNEALSYWQGLQRNHMKQLAAAQNVSLLKNGQGFLIASKDDQRDAMDAITRPFVTQMFAALQSPDPAARAGANQALGQLLQAQQASGVVVPNTILKNRYDAIKQMAPLRDAAPTPEFIGLAEWYSQMPPNIQAAYVTDDDTRAVLESFNRARSGGHSDDRTAFQGAFTIISAEAVKTAKEKMADPAFRQSVQKWTKSATTEWYQFNILGNSPTNNETVGNAALIEAENYIRTNPHLAGDSDRIKSHLQQWVAKRFVQDKTTDLLVEVPDGHASPETSDAITEFMRKKTREYGEEAGLNLIHLQNGQYHLMATGDGGRRLLETGVSLSDLVDVHRARFIIDPATEGARLKTLHDALINGTATLEMLNQESDLIGKAQSVGAWDKKMIDRVIAVKSKAFQQDVLPALSNVPRSDPALWDKSRLPTTGTTKQDISRRYWDANQSGKSLTVLGEGVRSKVYLDSQGIPTIGIGYNLRSNARTLKEDFRRSGIPADAIEDIKAGRKELTQDQIMRLFDISYFRAEDTARKNIESLYGEDAWTQLGGHRKAVLVDVAFNIGDIREFAPTLQKFMNDVGSLQEQNLKVHERKKVDGQVVFVPLKERNNLRLAMLGGMLSFNGVIKHVEGKPRNAVQAHALTNSPQE